MVKIVHIIVVGDEDLEKHLGGVPIFGAVEVLFFDIVSGAEEGKVDVLMKRLDEMGVPSEKREVDDKYGEIYWAAFQEKQRRSGEEGDISFGINLSTGMRLSVAAVEDAIMAPSYMGEQHLYHGHGFKEPEAFRYEVFERQGKIAVRTAPLHPLSGTPFPKTRDKYLVSPRPRVVVWFRNFRYALPIKWMFFKNKMRRRFRQIKRKLKLRL